MYVTAQDKLGCFQSKPISGLSNVTMTQLLQKNLQVILDHSFLHNSYSSILILQIQ